MTTPLDKCPRWLHLRVVEPMPSSWASLVDPYTRLVSAMLAHDPPKLAILSFQAQDGGLNIRLRCSPPEADPLKATLRDVADRLQDLSRTHRAAAQKLADLDTDDHAVATDSIEDTITRLDELEDYPFALDPVDPIEETSPEPSLPVFKLNTLESSDGGKARGRNDDTSTRIDRTMRRLRMSGFNRPVRRPATDWSKQLDVMEQDLPNFSAVIDSVVRPHLGLISMGYRHRMPPVMLIGPPGIGKTHFARSLHRALGVPPPLFLSMAAETNGSALGGSSTFWANSSPGELFERMAWGSLASPGVANELIVIDEIDKVGTLDHDPLGALYSLLEAETACVFRDQSLPDIIIDASQLRFLITANSIELIPEPIRSRCIVFEIATPSPTDQDGIVNRMFCELIEKLGIEMDRRLPQILLLNAREISPRQVKIRLEATLAFAALGGRRKVEIADWHRSGAHATSAAKRRIGFTHQR